MKKKILIVDDDIDILDALKIILQREGYKVETTFKGEETYKKVDTYKPDIILLDVLMSGSDGRTICKNLKKNKKTQQIPIIMISAHPSAVNEYIQNGANDFLAKPFETEEMLAVVKKNLKG